MASSSSTTTTTAAAATTATRTKSGDAMRTWSAVELANHYATEAQLRESGGAEAFLVRLAGAENAVAVADRARMLTDMVADGVRCPDIREHTAPPLFGGLWAHADNARSVYRRAGKLHLFPAWYDAKYREKLAPEDHYYAEAPATSSATSTSSSPLTLSSASSPSASSLPSPLSSAATGAQ
jgi:hypothetical protein